MHIGRSENRGAPNRDALLAHTRPHGRPDCKDADVIGS
jgi:hypothetical protein